jgi:hypothetical protein
MPCSISRFPIAVAAAFAIWLGAVPPADAFDQEAAWEYLVEQVSFGPRAPGTEGHEACLDWMIESLRARADRVEPHTFVMADPYGEGSLRLTNVKASFRPEAAVRVAFAAHWDTRPRADREVPPSDQPILGANDGASGVAVLMALADVLRDDPPPFGVDLLFFDGEDYGREGDLENYLLGSLRFVEDFPGYRPAALVLLDMVGKKNLRIPMEIQSLQQNPTLVRVVFNRALTLGLDVFDPVPGRPVHDDHVPFLRRGIPAVNLIDLDYPAWHTLQDTPDQCDPDSLGQVGRLLVALIRDDFARGRGLTR